MMKRPYTKKMTSSVEETATAAAIEPAHTNSNVTMNVESSNLKAKTTNTDYYLPYHKKRPLPKISQSNINKPSNHNINGFGSIDQNALNTACDGVKVLPVKLESYQSMEITKEDYLLCKKIGMDSSMVDKKGNQTPCFIVKTTNAFAVVFKCGDGYNCQWTMSRFDIVKKVKGSDNLAFVDILIHDELGEQTARVPRTVFAVGKLNSLTKFDLAVNFNTELESAMGIYFTKLLDTIPMEDASQVLGVVKDHKTKSLIFNGYGEYGMFKVANKYGTFDGYLEHFNPLLAQSKPLQYLLSATMAAPVMAILQEKYNRDVHSYIINAVGESSTGKTISSRVCASAWTNPKDKIIFSAMLSTANASLKKLAGRFGVPTFVDEATASGIKASNYAYPVYNGIEKDRLNSDCSMKASGSWSTIVCMSSEEHFHTNAKNQNGGLAVRVHSVDDQKWTENAEHANALNQFIAKNYGVLGKAFTDDLFQNLNNPKFALENKYDAAVNTMKKLCKANQCTFTDRLCDLYGLTYMTAEMLKNLGLAIDVNAVAKIMVGHHKMVSEDQNLALNAFRAVLSYLARVNEKTTKGIRKYTDNNLKLTKVAIERSLMADILDKAGCKDEKVTVKSLDKAGYLIRQGEGKGLLSKLTINGVLCYCYQIDLRSMIGTEDDDTEEGIVNRVVGKDCTLQESKEDAEGIVIYDDTAESEDESEEPDEDADIEELICDEEEEAEPEEDFEDDADTLSEDAESDEDFWDEDADTDEEESEDDAETMDEETESEEVNWNVEDDESEADEDFEDDADTFGNDAEPKVGFDFGAFRVEGADEADDDDAENDEDIWNVEEESDAEQESEDDAESEDECSDEEDADDDTVYVENCGIDWDDLPSAFREGYVDDDEDDDDEDDEYDE